MGQLLNPVPRQWDEPKFESVLSSKELFMDKSREVFVEYHKNIMRKMMDGSQAKSNRFRQLLLGRKGIGKTELMMALREAVEAAGDIIFVYIDFSNPSTALAPFDHVFRVLPCDVQFEYFKLRKADVAHIPTFRYQWLNEALHRRGRVVLIAVDEFHLVYGPACKIGAYIIEELHTIGGLDGRSIHCILSGSSHNVRKLAFCKIDDPTEASLYPNYKRVDLNSTRYVPFQILPFSESSTVFKGAVTYLLERMKSQKVYSDEDLVNLLECSGGCVGSLLIMLDGLDAQPYTTSSKGLSALDKDQLQLLEKLFMSLDVFNIPNFELSSDTGVDNATRLNQPTLSLEDVFKKIKPVRLDVLKAEYAGFLNPSLLYELVDGGFLHLYQEGNSGGRISFSMPSYYDELDRLYYKATQVKLSELVALK